MNLTVRRWLALFLPLVVVVTLGSLLLYVVVQQDLRQSADDPQHQLAEDAVARLAAGDAPASVVGAGQVDIAASLAPFVIVYDASGSVLAASGRLDGAAPVPPAGVLTTASQTGTDRVTWQPRPSVRIAAVVLRWNGGTVLAGRSLRRVEEIESALGGLVSVGWLVLLAAAATAALVGARLWPDLDHRPPTEERGAG